MKKKKSQHPKDAPISTRQSIDAYASFLFPYLVGDNEGLLRADKGRLGEVALHLGNILGIQLLQISNANGTQHITREEWGEFKERPFSCGGGG